MLDKTNNKGRKERPLLFINTLQVNDLSPQSVALQSLANQQ